MLCGMWRSLRGEMWNQIAPELQDKIPLSCRPNCVFFLRGILGDIWKSYESGCFCRWAQTQPPGAHELSYNASSAFDIPLEDTGWLVWFRKMQEK